MPMPPAALASAFGAPGVVGIPGIEGWLMLPPLTETSLWFEKPPEPAVAPTVAVAPGASPPPTPLPPPKPPPLEAPDAMLPALPVIDEAEPAPAVPETG